MFMAWQYPISGSIQLYAVSTRRKQQTLSKFDGQESLAIDEIEKDLNRSLPEYPGFQNKAATTMFMAWQYPISGSIQLYAVSTRRKRPMPCINRHCPNLMDKNPLLSMRLRKI
jgi:hypothetical protein